ncbi:MAG: DNA/RNA non-specific endonuclease [Marinirhabdus sp.]|nr:DNA/RNA non-specific endonuclease [Marinirhabdus sp.]
MARRFIYVILVVGVTVGLYYGERYVDRLNEDYPKNADATTQFSEFNEGFLPESTTGEVVQHPFFALSYAEEHEQAEWVAYELQANHIKANTFERPYFVEDRQVASGSADWRNYKNSGYDRGHLVAAADRGFNYDAYHQTFLTSNISPQNHDFNRGIWNSLEQQVRRWAKEFNGVFVVTGGILTAHLDQIGDEGVSVPKAFFKIVLDKRNGDYKAIAFRIPNQPTNRSFYEYVVSIDALEEETGIDFFPKLPKSLQASFEASTSNADW